MAGRVIGTASVKIIADAGGFRSGLKGISGAVSGMVHGISRAISALGLDTLARDAIKMGTEYRKQIDNARASVVGLTGSQAEADDLMKRMTKFAVATPFDLPGVQNVTTRLLALGKGFGVTSGNVLDYVKILGDTAAINGKGADSMLNVAQALGKISGQGRVMTRDMNQLTANFPSIHPWEVLADMTGKTEQELRKLASKPGGLSGIVDASEFINVLMLRMAAADGAAGAMDRRMQTLEGTMELFKDTMGVALADGLQPFFRTIQGFLSSSSIQDALVGLIAVFGNLASIIIDGLGSSFPVIIEGFTALVGALGPLAPIITVAGQMFGQLLQAIVPLVDAFLKGLVPMLPMVRGLFTQLLAAIAPVALQLVNALLPVIPLLVNLFAQLVLAVVPLVSQLITGLAPVLPLIATLFTEILSALAPLISQIIGGLLPVLAPLAELFTGLVRAIAPVLVTLVGLIAQLLPSFLSLLQAVAPIVPLIGEALIGAVGALMPLVKALVPLITKFAGILIAALKPVLPIIVQALNKLVIALVPLIEQMGDQLLSILESILPLLPSLAQLFLAILTAIAPLLPILTQLIALYVGVQETLLSLVIPVLIKVVEFLTFLVDNLAIAIEWVTNFSNVWDVLMTALDAIKDALGTVKDVFVSIWQDVLQPIGDFLVKVFAVAWEVLKAALYPVAIQVGLLVVAWQLLYDNVLQPIGHFIADVFTELWHGLKDALDIVKNAVGFVSDAFSAVWRNVLEPFWHGVLEPIGRFLKAEFTKAWDDTRAAVDFLKDAFNAIKSAGQILWDKLRDIWSWMTDNFEKVWGKIQSAGEAMGRGLKTVADGIKKPFEVAFNAIKDLWNNTIGGFGIHIPSIGPFGGADFTIPEMAMGGIIAREGIFRGAEGNRPEAVIPLTNPGRAMQLMQQAGLDRLAAQMRRGDGFGAGPLITMPGAVIQDATDADLVAQRTLVAMRSAMLPIR